MGSCSGKAHEHSNDSPTDQYASNPNTRSNSVHEQVAGYFKNEVAQEEDSRDQSKLLTGNSQFLVHCHCANSSRGCYVSASKATAPSTLEATTIRKLQTHIIPFVFVLFMIAFLDRINIGFAALTMNKELAVTSQQFGLVAGIFFFGYFVFEIPSNLLMHRIGARIWIARILISWGIVAVLTGFARTATHLYILRFLLGVAEAGYVPGIYLYLTYWFNQRQLAHAIALFN